MIIELNFDNFLMKVPNSKPFQIQGIELIAPVVEEGVEEKKRNLWSFRRRNDTRGPLQYNQLVNGELVSAI